MVAGEHIETALVLGDIALDTTVHLAESIPRSSRTGADITFVGDAEHHLGGTGFLFARALQEGSRLAPTLIGAVGRDHIGAAALEALTGVGLMTTGVRQLADQKTCSPTVIYFGDGTRLMVRPDDHAGRAFELDQESELLYTLAEGRCRLLFISGYCLVDKGSKVARSARTAARWAADHRIPVIVDLVPHEFREVVGSIEAAIALLGAPIDGWIAEYRTALGLGLAEQPSVEEWGNPGSMASAASALASHGAFAIIQRQIRPNSYSQVFCRRGEEPKIMGPYAFVENERLGLGDLLAVKALVEQAGVC